MKEDLQTGEISWNNQVIPAMLRCKNGAGLPSLRKGWRTNSNYRFSILYGLRELLSEPGYVAATNEHRRKLADWVVELLSDQEEFKGAKTWRRGKLIFPYERICDLAAVFRIQDLKDPPEFNAEAPRAERDAAIVRLKECWLDYSRK